METVLAQRAGHDAGAADFARALVRIWNDIDIALSPILGQRGVALLYKRSLYLVAQRHSWLASTHEGAQTTMDLDALNAAFAQRPAAEAASVGGALLQSFHELLVSLIGPSLTERLLRSVLAPSPGGQPAQDTTA